MMLKRISFGRCGRYAPAADPYDHARLGKTPQPLFLALGAVRTERVGSAVSFVLNDVRADFHRPHPDKAALRYRVKDARKFLKLAGIKP